MYKAIIVDDEKMIRLGMRKAIPWHSIGIGEVFVAGSGPEALGIIRQQKPEIMITDIKMDGMTGLELIDQVREAAPEMRILVLTGFDSFEYARQCIKLKVHDFFLKPIDEHALIEAIRKQVDFLEQSKASRLTEIIGYRADAVMEQIKLESFLKDLVHNRLANKEERVDEFCMRYHCTADQQMQAAILVPTLYMGDGKEEESYMSLSIKNVCIGMVDAQDRGFTFLDDAGRIVIAFLLDKQRGVLDWLQELNGILKDEFSGRPKFVVGNPVDGMRFLNTSYGDAVHLLRSGKDGLEEIIQTENAQQRADLYKDVFGEMKNAMCASIGDPDRVLSIFERFRQSTDSYNLSESYIRRCCFELASSMYYVYVSSSGEEADDRVGIFVNSLAAILGEELFEVTREFLKKLLFSKEDQNVHEIVDKAKRYIKEHLSSDLSASNIAAYLYISPNYLSRLFKKATGEGCNEYIVRKRIEKAKQLLETTNLQTGKISLMVGYRDTNYFSLAFKKNTGMAPVRYREVVQKKEESGTQYKAKGI